MLSLTLRQIEYASAIARAGSVTRAAAAVHISQPALSNALTQLERTLGQPLFLRRAGEPMVATRFGQVWLAEAENLLAGLGRLSRGQIRVDSLRLALFEDLGPVHLPALLAAFAASAPDINLRPALLGFDALSEALEGGECDLALTWELGLSPRIATRVLARIAPHAVLHPDHPLALSPSLTLAELEDQPLVLTDQGLSLQHMRGLFGRAGLRPNLAHRVATPDLMRGYAAHGFGIGLAYTHPDAPCAPDGAPLCLRPIHDAGTEALVLAWRKGEVMPLSDPQAGILESHFTAWNSKRFDGLFSKSKAP